MFDMSSSFLDDMLQSAAPLIDGTINEVPGQFASHRDNCILELLGWGESSTTIQQSPGGHPNSVVDWI